VDDIIAQYEPKPLAPEQNREMDKILEEARRYYTDKGLI
jgi:hypothetical protein